MATKSYGPDVRVSKAGGVGDIAEAQMFYPAPEEVESLIKDQKRSIENFTKCRDDDFRTARIQEQLEAEAKQLLVQNRDRLQHAREAVKTLENEVSLAIEKERQLELKRALAHEEVAKKEQERAQARAAEILLIEEIKETEKLARVHENNKMIAMTSAQAREIDIREAELKIQAIQLRGQLPVTPAQPAQPSPLKIEVEVPARDIPEQRVFSEASQQGTSSVAAAEIKESYPPLPPKSKKAVKKAVAGEESDKFEASEVKEGGELRPHGGEKKARKTGVKKFTGIFSKAEQQQ